MEIAAPSISRPAAGVIAKPASRLLFIDNIRVFLTILVILHHLMIIYAGSGGWIYYEGRQDDITDALGGWFCAVNQAYFMGLFLFISAYFVPGAYDRKGPVKFLVDRLVRLGIPLVVYSWVLRPLFIFYALHPGITRSFWVWYRGEYFRVYGLLGGGPLWFIEALLLFSIVYALGRLVFQPRSPIQDKPPQAERRFPGSGTITLFALGVGVMSFLVRLVSPVNVTFDPLNLQFANFAQYIALFAAGLVAYRQNWLAALPDKTGKRWLVVTILLIFLFVPLALVAGAAESDEPFLGGWHYQALVFALWEAFLCVSACLGLIYLFRRRLNSQGPVSRELSRSAYTAYLIHEPVITVLAILGLGVHLYPLLKFVLAGLVMIPACFAISSLLRRLPYVRTVLS